MASKGEIVGIDWNRIARLHSHVLAHMFNLQICLLVSVSPVNTELLKSA